MSYKLGSFGFVIRLADNAQIPPDPRNRDRVDYDAWVAAGNLPAPADAPVDIDINNLDKTIRTIGLLIAQYTGKTPLQVRSDFMAIYKTLP